MTLRSISPRAAPISVTNFSHTSCRIPSLLFSARVLKKFLTVSFLSRAPICFCSSCTIWDLSCCVNVGALRILESFESFLKTSERAERDLDVLSNEEVFAAAVY